MVMEFGKNMNGHLLAKTSEISELTYGLGLWDKTTASYPLTSGSEIFCLVSATEESAHRGRLKGPSSFRRQGLLQQQVSLQAGLHPPKFPFRNGSKSRH